MRNINNQIHNKNNDNNNELVPTAPYIKEKLTKKFCLVLDLDLTLIYSIFEDNLGSKLEKNQNYFFVRPGVFELLIP